MADANVIEKYPDSFRINHPDLGNVIKTAYVKGVITKFQARGDLGVTDPLVVKELCSVETDLGSFQNIPIFYHPKRSWCTEQNLWGQKEEAVEGQPIPTIRGGALSFWEGAEVMVQMKEGTPVAVLGHYRKPPSLPFNFFKVSGPSNPWPPESKAGYPRVEPLIVQTEPVDKSDSEEDPDGFDLGLTEEIPKLRHTAHPSGGAVDYGPDINSYFTFFYKDGVEVDLSYYDYPFIPNYQYSPYDIWLEVWKSVQENMFLERQGRSINAYDSIKTTVSKSLHAVQSGSEYWDYYLLEIGPKLFLISIYWFYYDFVNDGELWYWENMVSWNQSTLWPIPTWWWNLTLVPFEVTLPAYPMSPANEDLDPDNPVFNPAPTGVMPIHNEYSRENADFSLFSAPASESLKALVAGYPDQVLANPTGYGFRQEAGYGAVGHAWDDIVQAIEEKDMRYIKFYKRALAL